MQLNLGCQSSLKNLIKTQKLLLNKTTCCLNAVSYFMILYLDSLILPMANYVHSVINEQHSYRLAP